MTERQRTLVMDVAVPLTQALLVAGFYAAGWWSWGMWGTAALIYAWGSVDVVEPHVASRGRVWLGRPDVADELLIIPVVGIVYYLMCIRWLRRVPSRRGDTRWFVIAVALPCVGPMFCYFLRLRGWLFSAAALTPAPVNIAEKSMRPFRPEDISSQTIYWQYIEPGKLDEGIRFLEDTLRGITPETSFHAILGRNFDAQCDEAFSWLTKAHSAMSETCDIRAIELELVGIDMAFDAWTFAGIGFPRRVYTEDDIGDYETTYDEEFALRGMEDIQEALRAYEEAGGAFGAPEQLQTPATIAFLLVLLNFQRLARLLHEKAQGTPLADIQLIAAMHESDAIYTTQ